jgi:hypothetical protein
MIEPAATLPPRLFFMSRREEPLQSTEDMGPVPGRVVVEPRKAQIRRGPVRLTGCVDDADPGQVRRQ